MGWTSRRDGNQRYVRAGDGLTGFDRSVGQFGLLEAGGGEL